MTSEPSSAHRQPASARSRLKPPFDRPSGLPRCFLTRLGGPICFRSRNRCGRRRISKLATWQPSASGSDCDQRLGFSVRQLVRQGVPVAGCCRGGVGFRDSRSRGEDANLAGVWLILVTLPGSLLASPVSGLVSGRLSTVIFFCALAISALINAAVISLLVHAVSRLLRSRA